MTSIEFKRLGPGDAAALDRVADDVFDAPIDKDRAAAYLREPGHFMFVAIADGIVIAQARAMRHRHPDEADELYIDNFGVAPAFQRKGIARRLLDELLKLGRELGCEEAWVGTEQDNAAAKKLYESARGDGEDCVFYTYKL
jgi:ribosomal protein S18 acetylase RimI-like enzyme